MYSWMTDKSRQLPDFLTESGLLSADVTHELTTTTTLAADVAPARVNGIFERMTETALRQLQSEGFTVQSKRQYAPLWFENGRPMVLPVEDTKIVPVNNKVF